MRPRDWMLIAAALATCAAGTPGMVPVSPAPGAPPYTGAAALRFPQPVRVGDLIDRQVLQPIEAQHVLGRVAAIVRAQDGGIAMLVRFGGFLGFGTRLIDVPIDTVALLGEYVAVMDLTPAQLAALPTANETGLTALPPDTIIRMGLTGPFH